MTARNLAMRNYMGLLNSLSDDMKLALVDGLTKSIGEKKESDIESLFGIWEDDKCAEDIIDYIRSSRITGTREIESFD